MSNDPNLAFEKYSIVQHLDKGKIVKMDKAKHVQRQFLYNLFGYF